MRHVYRVLLIAFLAAMPLAASAQQAFTVRDTEVFAGPSSEFPPIAVLPPSARVRIAGCLADWSWCDVIFSRYRGWVYAADLVVPYQNNRVAVIEYGPQLGLVVVTFSLHGYWDRHYRAQPWYVEREQWASRVRIEGNRGGPPPKGRSAQTERTQPQPGRSPQAGPPAERPRGIPESGRSAPGAGGTPPPERSKRIPESGRSAPGAGGKPPEAKPRPEGARPKDEGARGGETVRPPQGKPSPQAGPPAERSKGVPEAGRSAPGAGGKPPEAKPRPEGARPKDEGARGGGAAGPAKSKGGKKDGDRD